MADPIRIHGFSELSRAFAHAEKETKKAFRDDLRQLAEPVRQDAERLAVARIRKVGAWSGMRIGVLRRVVYVAPRKRGVRGGPRSRPKFGTMLMDRSMQPALDHNIGEIEREAERMLDKIGRDWGND